MTHDDEGGRSAMLVDGNHVFVGVLQQVEIFFELISNPEILNELDIFPAYLKKFRADTGKDPITTYRKTLNAIDYADIAFDNILINGLSVLPSKGRLTEISWFDAEMDPPEKVLSDLAAEEQRRPIPVDPKIAHHPAKPRERYIALLEAGLYEYRLDDKRVVQLPYNLKNEFIAEMYGKQYQGIEINAGLGFRKYYHDKRLGSVTSSEKQVDTKLAIYATDIAHNQLYSHVELVTNDGDHAPTVKRLRRGGKTVQVFSITTERYQAKALKDAAGRENCETLGSAMKVINRQQELVAAFGNDFASTIDRCPLFFPLLNRMQMDIPFLAVTGVTHQQALEIEVSESVKDKLKLTDEMMQKIRSLRRRPTKLLD
jgi:uncharacterized LabA/DUF88 family protein